MSRATDPACEGRLCALRVFLWLSGLLLFPGLLRAEVAELLAARQYGLSYLPLMVMESEKLVEKHAAHNGLGKLSVSWKTFVNGPAMNDAIISGNLHFASGAVGALATIWSKTQGNIGVKGVAALNAMPVYLVTRNPKVKTIGDLTSEDRIALPAIKISTQAVVLEIAAAQMLGDANWDKLNPLTVSLGHPDAMAALVSGKTEINAHFSAPPYQYAELALPGMRKVLNSYDVLGGMATFNVVWTTSRFRSENPKAYAAFYSALQEAVQIINADLRKAAEFYLNATKERSTSEEVERLLKDPEISFSTTPMRTFPVVSFMNKIGTVSTKPTTWKDLFFPEVHGADGS